MDLAQARPVILENEPLHVRQWAEEGVDHVRHRGERVLDDHPAHLVLIALARQGRDRYGAAQRSPVHEHLLGVDLRAIEGELQDGFSIQHDACFVGAALAVAVAAIGDEQDVDIGLRDVVLKVGETRADVASVFVEEYHRGLLRVIIRLHEPSSDLELVSGGYLNVLVIQSP